MSILLKLGLTPKKVLIIDRLVMIIISDIFSMR